MFISNQYLFCKILQLYNFSFVSKVSKVPWSPYKIIYWNFMKNSVLLKKYLHLFSGHLLPKYLSPTTAIENKVYNCKLRIMIYFLTVKLRSPSLHDIDKICSPLSLHLPIPILSIGGHHAVEMIKTFSFVTSSYSSILLLQVYQN
jgi:hypothetical protein